MTNYFFDTDCLSAFLWVQNECLLTQLYSGKIVLPKEVYDELRRVPHLFSRVNTLVQAGQVTVMSLQNGTPESEDYIAMITHPDAGQKLIGKGEAAAIALTKKHNGILASNNLSDINCYVTRYNLNHITTGDILVEALNRGLITENYGNRLWAQMLTKRRKLPTQTFSDYLLTK